MALAFQRGSVIFLSIGRCVIDSWINGEGGIVGRTVVSTSQTGLSGRVEASGTGTRPVVWRGGMAASITVSNSQIGSVSPYCSGRGFSSRPLADQMTL